jgi:hypothetical protein
VKHGQEEGVNMHEQDCLSHPAFSIVLVPLASIVSVHLGLQRDRIGPLHGLRCSKYGSILHTYQQYRVGPEILPYTESLELSQELSARVPSGDVFAENQLLF